MTDQPVATSSPTTVSEYAEGIATEYGKWVAKDAIYIGGALAFNAGDPVPVSHVDSGVVPKDLVVGRDTKTGQAAIAANPTTATITKEG